MSNYTNERCGCIPYFLPKNKQVTTCSKKQAKCQQEAKSTVELSSEASQEIIANCKCLPGCFEVTYKKTGTYSSLGIEYYMNASQEKTNYDKKNIAKAHFFFEHGKFSKQVKSEVFGFTDVVSSCGGLLSLFVGFSLLSLIEFVYFATLRLLCKKMRRHRSRPSFMSHVLK
ncbi:hypothetical protein WA026_000985 [Henosepilachna vigintioctopunctata]|uniref:Uncharacterized protein n=1 Tax=Henosepilachna vigintioctopunctata TaxID=420089 RepID=A0AAW1V284_9CUCU